MTTTSLSNSPSSTSSQEPGYFTYFSRSVGLSILCRLASRVGKVFMEYSKFFTPLSVPLAILDGLSICLVFLSGIFLITWLGSERKPKLNEQQHQEPRRIHDHAPKVLHAFGCTLIPHKISQNGTPEYLCLKRNCWLHNR